MKRTLMAFLFIVLICTLLACGTSTSTTTSAPYSPGVEAVAGNGQVAISLLEVAPNAPTVSSYDVYYSTTDPVTMSSGTEVSGITSTSTTITGLSNGTMYYFIATAVNTYGESGPSPEARAMPEINIGTVTILASGLSNPYGIAIDSTNVYWTEDGSTPITIGPGTVKKVGINGGTVTTLYSGLSGFNGGPRSISVDSTSVYWTDNLSGTVNKELISGGTVTNLTSGMNNNIQGIAVDATSVYWADVYGIRKVGINGGNVTTLASETSGCPRGIAVDSTSVYWTDMCNWTINKVGINGGTVTVLASGSYAKAENGPWGIAVDSTSVYWTEFNWGGSIYKVGINGGAMTTVASGLAAPQNLAVDSNSVYWTEPGSGTVKKVSK